ncbi:MAG: RNA-directed DNA polymerase [Clostridia bacterium]|nr:RNA-directed DNA polymerase [Clostridia bacterium]
MLLWAFLGEIGVKITQKIYLHSIHKFFDSVPHDKLRQKFHDLIHDEKFLRVIDTVIEANGKDVGIPIGFYTSQWFANFYLTKLDHYIKEELGAKGYFRFMDDMVIFGGNKRVLHKMRDDIENYLRISLGLEMNPAWQVFLFHYVKRDGTEIGRFLDFMGFRFYRNRTTLRRALMLKASRKARKIAKKKPKTAYDCRQMLSYKGWISPANVYGMYTKWIKPYVSFRQMRRYVGIVQRKENKERMKSICGTRAKTAI